MEWATFLHPPPHCPQIRPVGCEHISCTAFPVGMAQRRASLDPASFVLLEQTSGFRPIGDSYEILQMRNEDW